MKSDQATPKIHQCKECGNPISQHIIYCLTCATKKVKEVFDQLTRAQQRIILELLARDMGRKK